MNFAGSSSTVEETYPLDLFQVTDRWNRTATDGFVINSRGTPRTLTWGIVPDGTSITGAAEEPTAESDLIARLDTIYNTISGTDLTASSWFTHFETSFNRWAEISGISFVYEPNDDGSSIINSSSSAVGLLGVRADHRIGGHPIDGNSGILAYNYFPDHADMVIDTNDSFFDNTNLDSRRLENVVMHEIGHGLGFSHLESSNSSQLMEPSINISIHGPQIDDILAAQRNYGDPLEKNGGNDNRAGAHSLGILSAEDSWAIGTDGSSSVVTMDQTDFISIDGSSDEDYFTLNVSESTLIDLTLTQVGSTYNEGAEDEIQTVLDTSALNPLSLSLLDSSVTLTSGSPLAVGNGESIASFQLDAGIDYYIHVEGSVDNVQLYQLEVALSAISVPEPAGLTLFAIASTAMLRRSRKGSD